MTTPAAFSAALHSAASAIGVIPEHLGELIAFESSWNPAAYNKSGAVGLIQFMPQTLKDMGVLPVTVSSKIPSSGVVPESVKQETREAFLMRFPTVESQLAGPVVDYLRKWKPFPTKQSLFMAVFYPAYRFVEPDTLFPEKVRAYNPGIDTVQAYMDFAKKKNDGAAVVEKVVAGGGVLAALGALYLLWRTKS